MSDLPPARSNLRFLPLAVAIIAAACGSIRPSPPPSSSPLPSPAGPSQVAGRTPPASSVPAEPGHPFADLLSLSRGDLVLLDPNGVARLVPGPDGGPVEAVAAARGTIVVRTAGGVLHVATLVGSEIVEPGWRAIGLDPGDVQRPLTELALSPDGRRLAVLAAEFGSGQPFEAVIIDVETGTARVVPILREPNGPPVWSDPATVLLEVVPGSAGGPFLRLDVDGGSAESVPSVGYGPAVATERSVVAVLGDEPGVRILPVAAWLAGADRESGELVPVDARAVRVAMDPAGDRIAVSTTDRDGAATSLDVYRRDGPRWAPAGRIDGEPPRWFGWLR
jgi:hypothetical protein